ncbi:isocitrate lyase/phosphoenolpyruvate mutase family protein [Chelatococcus sp. GCM10030263]|uniref:isocitrate lyase/phosphoenolpyruvate mutase family protein n=1 Tax=Chelatococcus sp. GCM10030263 TaxID=3273387 RepID=UPI00362439F3
MSLRRRLREAHAAGGPLVSPLAHDALSARLIEHAGFGAFNIGGSSLLAASYALPDLGIAGLGEMASAMREVVGAVKIPALVDADDGYVLADSLDEVSPQGLRDALDLAGWQAIETRFRRDT